MDLIKVAELLVDKIRKDYRDDVALVVVMGSYIYNDTHARSDLDMFFVPKTQRSDSLGFVFIIDGIGFDYWGISWERLEQIANHEERTTSIITEGRVLYSATEEDLERFNALKRKALDTSDRSRFVHKAGAKLDEAYKDYFRLLEAQTLSDARMRAVGILYTATYALALLNRITVKRGRGKLKKEIMDMPLVPEGFSAAYDAVFFGKDIAAVREACGSLIRNTGALISAELTKDSGTVPFAQAMSGFYEEAVNLYNKVYHACEISEPYCALFAGAELVHEISQALAGTGVCPEALPDIIAAYDPGALERYAAAVREHETRFVGLLEANGVRIRRIKDLGELERCLETL